MRLLLLVNEFNIYENDKNTQILYKD